MVEHHYRVRYIPGDCYMAQHSNDGQQWDTIKRVSTKYLKAKQWAQSAIEPHHKRQSERGTLVMHTMVIG